MHALLQSAQAQQPAQQQRMTPNSSGGSLLRRMDVPLNGAGVSSQSNTFVQQERGGGRQQYQTVSTNSDPNAALVQPQQPLSATAQRRLTRIAQLTMQSVPPPSYERARPYVPPPLPPGYRVSQNISKQHARAHP